MTLRSTGDSEPVFVSGKPALSGERDEPWKELVRAHLRGTPVHPTLTFVVSALRRRGQPFDLDNLVHPVLYVMEDPIDCVSARLFVGEPAGVLIEDRPPIVPPDEARTVRGERASKASDRNRVGIPEIANDPPFTDHEGIGLFLRFDANDVPIRLGWYGPTEAVIDDLKPWLGTYTSRQLVADHRLRDLRISRGAAPGGGGVTIDIWYVPDADVFRIPRSVSERIERLRESCS
jgi:hypothetical protein